ncbi:beta:beta-carotene 9', partial [Dinothrombium tinctorium]
DDILALNLDDFAETKREPRPTPPPVPPSTRDQRRGQSNATGDSRSSNKSNLMIEAVASTSKDTFQGFSDDIWLDENEMEDRFSRSEKRRSSAVETWDTKETVVESDLIPLVPELEEAIAEDLMQQTADAPAVNTLIDYKQLEEAILKHSTFALFEGIELSLLIKRLIGTNQLKEEDVCWKWDNLISEVAKLSALKSAANLNGKWMSSDKRILHPVFRSCTQECDQPVEANINGEVPLWLKGYLLRNGTGLKQIGNDRYKHLFDGLACIHQFHIESGKVTYKNKFLRSLAYEKNMRTQRIVVSEFGTRGIPDPCKTLFKRYLAYFTAKGINDNDCVNFYPVGNDLYASTESPFIRTVNPQTLESQALVNVAKYVKIDTQTAHPHAESDGTIYNMGSKLGKDGCYNIIKIPATKNAFDDASVLAKIPMKSKLYPSYYHSFCMTKNYIIFIEQPLVLSLPSILKGLFTGSPISEAFQWKSEKKTQFHVVAKKTGEVIPITFKSDAFAFFHTINAYEDEDYIVCDICCYSDGNVIHKLYSDVLRQVHDELSKSSDLSKHEHGKYLASQARRFVLPLKTANKNAGENLVTLKNCEAKAIRNKNEIFLLHENLTEPRVLNSEFPRINYDRYNGVKYRYFYGTSAFSSSLMKCDTEKKVSKHWTDQHHHCSEPIFVPHPEASREDEGVILSAVLSTTNERKGYLLILDASTFQTIAKAHFETPSAIPSDFHGFFVRN